MARKHTYEVTAEDSEVTGVHESVPMEKEDVAHSTAIGAVTMGGSALGAASVANILKQTWKASATEVWLIEARAYNLWLSWAALAGAVAGGALGYLSAREHNEKIDDISHQARLDMKRGETKFEDAQAWREK